MRRGMHKLASIGAAFALFAVQTGRSASDGVYTTAQAERGRARYERTCEACHGADLHGGIGASLAGEAFIDRWRGLGLDRLVDRVREMPPETSEHPDAAAAVDLVAYLLSANGFPAGETELDASGVERIRIMERGGSGDVPNFALVAIVGCLARAGEREWTVTRATDPVRTKNPDASIGDEQARTASTIRGSKTYKLLNVYPSPEKLDGHLVEAKGFLIRGPVDSVNVTALTSLATSCPR